MAHQHNKKLGALGAVIFACVTGVGCENTPIQEPTEAEQELLMQAWEHARASADFIKALAEKVDTGILATRDGKAGDIATFQEGVEDAYETALDIIDKGRLFVFDSGESGATGDAGAFYSLRIDGEVMAFNRNMLSNSDGLVDNVDPSIFLHEGAHRYFTHQSELNANSSNAIFGNYNGAHSEAVIAEHDFAYELSDLGLIGDEVYRKMSSWLHFIVTTPDRYDDPDEVERIIQNGRERIATSRMEDFVSDQFDYSGTRELYENYGLTATELTEALRETGLWENERNEILTEIDEWREGREKEIPVERFMEMRSARR